MSVEIFVYCIGIKDKAAIKHDSSAALGQHRDPAILYYETNVNLIFE